MERFPNYYGVLGVPQNASLSEIRRAFRKRALELHPDVNPSPDATEQFKHLNKAHYVLSDPVRRSVYDTLRASVTSSSGSNTPPASDTSAASGTSSAPANAFSYRKYWRVIFAGVGSVLRTPVFWIFASALMLGAWAVIFRLGLIDPSIALILAIVIGGGSSFYLDGITNRVESLRREGETVGPLEFAVSLNNVTLNLWVGTLGCSASIIVPILTIIVLVGIFVPNLTYISMAVFAITLIMSTLWFGADWYAQDRAASIRPKVEK